MAQDQSSEKTRTRIFKGSRYFFWNAWGATIAGVGGGAVMSVVTGHVLRSAPDFRIVLWALALELLLVVGILVAWPGNMIATFPYEVVVEESKGVRLRAVLKQVYIPIEDIRDIQKSFFQGYIVRLRRRHRLLGKFVIHRLFGREAEALVHAIQDAIST